VLVAEEQRKPSGEGRAASGASGVDAEPEGAPTELDVKLPSKIALAHAEETLQERVTLPRVKLPGRAALAAAPPTDPLAALPEIAPPGGQPLDPEVFRPTELVVKTPRIEGGGWSTALLVLLGIALGGGLTLLLIRLLR
jgi:hypothetical protein